MSKRNPRSRQVSAAQLDPVKIVWNRYGATQKDFATVLEISVGTFKNFLDGEPVDKAYFDKICDVLNLDPNEISEPIDSSENLPSPFITGNPITEPRYFFGRERELNRIFQLLNRHPLQHVAIIGDKRIGKTSLLHYLKNITQTSTNRLRQGQKHDWLTTPNRYRWVFVDFQDSNLQSQSGLIQHILKSLQIPRPPTCDINHFMEVMPQYLQQPTIILFDEIATVFQHSPELDDRFWESLRSLASNSARGNLAYILATPISPFELAKNYGYSSPFFNIFGYTAKLSTFTLEEAKALIDSAPQAFSTADVEWILAQSRCLPLVLQILCRECWLNLELEADEDWRTSALEQIAPFLPPTN
jgi:DNA-binding Xre family transcriptional regulator